MPRRSTTYCDETGCWIRVYTDTGVCDVARAPRKRCTAPYLCRAKACARACDTIEELAHALGVQVGTAWSYVTTIASEDEEFAADACRKFVCKCIRQTLREVEQDGSLTELVGRVSDCTGSHPEWREQEHVYSQVKLARLACS